MAADMNPVAVTPRMKLECEVLTPDRAVYQGEVDRLVVTGVDGEIGILPRHAPMVAALAMGEVRVTAHGETERIVVFGGLVEVVDNQAWVLAAGARKVTDLDAAELRRELEEAQAEEPEGAVDIADRDRRVEQLEACLKVLEGPEPAHDEH